MRQVETWHQETTRLRLAYQRIPWIGARDWRSMAAGCREQGVAAVRQVDGLLSHASGEDRFLLLTLRFATAAGAAIAGAAVMLWAV